MMKSSKPRARNPKKICIAVISLMLCVLMVGGLLTSALMTMASAASSSEIQ